VDVYADAGDARDAPGPFHEETPGVRPTPEV
jgi:hypothetical protein